LEYDGQLTVDEAERGMRLHIQRKRTWRWMFVGWFVVILGSSVLTRRGPILARATPAVVVAVINLGLVFVMLRWQIRRSVADQRALYVPFHSRIDDQGFETRTELDRQRRRWSDFRRWYEDERLFVLVESEAGVRIIPKRVLREEGQIAELRHYLRRHLGDAR
jgi:hypothetical protein